jgi:hypothetical protein
VLDEALEVVGGATCGVLRLLDRVARRAEEMRGKGG